MKIMFGHKDGGPESRVHMYGVESKRFGSILLLRFAAGSREAYHSHAFNCVSRILTGALYEDRMYPGTMGRVDGFRGPAFKGRVFQPRTGWFKTTRNNMHKVSGMAPVTWVFTLRGPWADTWREYVPRKGFTTLTHGRKEVV